MADDKSMLVKMAFLYVQSGEWYRAIEEYKKLLAIDPEDAHIYNMIGDAYAKKEDHADAFQAYLKSKEIYERQGMFNKIPTIEKKIGRLSPDRMDIKLRNLFNSFTKTQAADGLFAEGKFEEAVTYYRQLIAAEPINFSYREKLANLFLENAQVSEAAGQLKAIADIHLSEGRLQLAREYANRVSLMDPEGMDTLRLHATLAEKMGETENLPKYQGQLAQSAYDAGQYEEALQAVQAALQAGRADLKPLYVKILLALKRHKDAKAVLDELLALQPQDEALLEQLYNLSEDIKDWTAASGYLGTLLALKPSDNKLISRQAKILLQLGKRAEGFQIYMSLCNSAVSENKTDLALSCLDSILGPEPENIDALKKKGEIYLKLGRKQDLIETYKKLQTVFTQKKMPEEAKKIALILSKLAGLK